MAEPDLYIGKEPATFDFEGSPVFIGPGTVVRAGHPIMNGREDLFELLRVHYDVVAEPVVAPIPVEPTPVAENDLSALRKRAENLGVKVDGRWSAERLQQEIAKAEAKA